MSYPAPVEGVLQSLCKRYICGNISMDVGIAKFAGFLARYNYLCKTTFDLNECESVFIEQCNAIHIDQDITEALVAEYAKQAFARGTPFDDVLKQAHAENAQNCLDPSQVQLTVERAFEEHAVRMMAQQRFADKTAHSEIKHQAVLLAPHLQEPEIRAILRQEFNAKAA